MKTILRFLKPYKKLCIFTLLATILDILGALYIPTLTADMINIGINSRDMDAMLQKGLVMVGITLAAGGGTLLGSYLCASLSSKMGRDIRNELYRHSLTFSSYDFEGFGTGSMITRTLNDVNTIQQAVVWFIQMILPVPLICIFGIIMAFSIDSHMGALLLAFTVIVIILAILVTKKASVIFDFLQRFLDRMNVVLRENITGVRVIRAFGKESYEEKHLRKTFEDYAEYAIKANRLFAGLDCLSFFMINICIVLVLWFAGNRIGRHAMEIGDITAMIEYSILILFYLMMAQMVMLLLPRAQVCIRRIEEILSHVPQIQDGVPDAHSSNSDRSNGSAHKENTRHTPKDALNGRTARAGETVLSFDRVGFRFADADEETVSQLDFSLKRGQTTAIIGGTGSGKSTIAKLILRFHDVTDGSIRLFGSDIRRMGQQELRSHISYVPQKAWLFSGTIADNLRHGDPSASDSRMEHALSIAQADFVKALPDGVRSPVAQGGTNFSGGQKQRLSIARALTKQADLYIFDDSFSALDFKTDAALRKALANEVADAAVLIIAQRISTIRNAGQILVLDNGKIAGIGTHEALMETCRVYREIADSQMKGDDIHGKQ